MAFKRLMRLLRGVPQVAIHHARLDELEFEYRLRRSHRRTLALSVDDKGVQVNSPLHVGDEEIARFLLHHRDWLQERLRQRAIRLKASCVLLHDGALLPVLGKPCRLRFVTGLRHPRWLVANDGTAELHLAPGDIDKRLISALKARALKLYQGRVEEYCFRVGVSMPRVALTNARTRWGSCSVRSGIRLHWRLIHLTPELIDYVVAHEVAHLREMNHSPRFWSVVESVCPNWQNLRKRLRTEGARLPLIEGTSDAAGVLEE